MTLVNIVVLPFYFRFFANWFNQSPSPRENVMPIIRHSFIALFALALFLIAKWCLSANAQTTPAITIEGLLQEGWDVFGYTSTFDNRSSLILFRKPGKTYLVQCSTLYDVLRRQRTVSNCYELH
jgi:hypothetical protein